MPACQTTTVQDVVDGFASSFDAEIRVLLAGDMASEGLNLHHAVPPTRPLRPPVVASSASSSATAASTAIGQLHAPADHRARAPRAMTDVDQRPAVVTKLLKKEHEANRALGDAGVLLDLHDAEIEEER